MTVSPLHCTTREISPAVAVLSVQGRLDSFGARAFGDACADASRSPARRAVIVNLDGVTYLSSAALRVLTLTLKTVAARGGQVALCHVHEYCRGVIEIAGLDGHLPIFADEAAAVAQTGGQGPQAPVDRAWDQLEQWETPAAAVRAIPGPGRTRGAVEILGDIKDVLRADLTEAQVISKAFCETEYSIGCGALGDRLEDYYPIMGEMITIGGTMVWLPTDGHDTPDFLIPKNASRAVTLRTGFNASLTGGFDECLLVEAKDPEGLAIDQLYRLVFESARTRRPDYRGVIGLAGRAEFATVLGAGIRKSPIRRFQPANGQSILHPSNIADWFAGDHSPRQRNVTGLLCGVGVDLQSDLSAFDPAMVDLAFYRHPDNTAGKPHLLHNHAVFFTALPWPERPVDLTTEVNRVVDEGDFCDMRHLLDQSRIHRAFIGISYTQEIRRA
jgi:anti-anti-sigma factor